MIYTGSGIIPIIKDKNEKYYFILFKSTTRKQNGETLIEDSGGGFEGNNIKISAIRELKEESSLIFNLENFRDKKNIIKLNKILTSFNIEIKESKYISYFIYLEQENEIFDLDKLKLEFKNNMMNFWQNNFSVYTENKEIVFIPIENINKIKEIYIKDNKKNKLPLFHRTLQIFNNLLNNYNINCFIKKVINNPIILNKKIINNYNYGGKYKINNLISYQ